MTLEVTDEILKVSLGLVLLGWWCFSFYVLSTSNDIKVFIYKADSLTVVFILLFLILTFVILLSFLKFAILGTVIATALSFISVYLPFSFELPLSEFCKNKLNSLKPLAVYNKRYLSTETLFSKEV